MILNKEFKIRSITPFQNLLDTNITIAFLLIQWIKSSSHFPSQSLYFLVSLSLTCNPTIKPFRSPTKLTHSISISFFQINLDPLQNNSSIVLQNYYFMLALDEVGFIKASLLIIFYPSTSTHQLESKLEIFQITLRLAYLNGNFSH